MKKEMRKTQIILYFLCAAIWFICFILDIINKDFSTQFYLHITCVVLFSISGFLALKGKSANENENNSEEK